jgi:hypothetical protein
MQGSVDMRQTALLLADSGSWTSKGSRCIPGPTGWKRVIDVSVAATVIAASVGAAAVLGGAYLTNSLGRRIKQGVQDGGWRRTRDSGP